MNSGDGVDIQPDPKWRGKNIYQRLLAIEGELGALVKGGTAPSNIGSFKFHEHTAVTAAIVDKLQEWNVFAGPVIAQYEEREVDMGTGSDGRKKIVHKSIVTANVLFRCADLKADDKDGVYVTSFPGVGLDTQDKDSGKAVSYAIKMAYLKTFKLDRTKGSGVVDNEADAGLDF